MNSELNGIYPRIIGHKYISILPSVEGEDLSAELAETEDEKPIQLPGKCLGFTFLKVFHSLKKSIRNSNIMLSHVLQQEMWMNI